MEPKVRLDGSCSESGWGQFAEMLLHTWNFPWKMQGDSRVFKTSFSHFQGKRSLSSSGSAPTYITLFSDWGPLSPEVFTPLSKDVSHLGTGPSAGCLLVQQQLFAGWCGGCSGCFRLMIVWFLAICFLFAGAGDNLGRTRWDEEAHTQCRALFPPLTLL